MGRQSGACLWRRSELTDTPFWAGRHPRAHHPAPRPEESTVFTGPEGPVQAALWLPGQAFPAISRQHPRPVTCPAPTTIPGKLRDPQFLPSTSLLLPVPCHPPTQNREPPDTQQSRGSPFSTATASKSGVRTGGGGGRLLIS